MLLLPQESKSEGVEGTGFDFSYCAQLFGRMGHWASWALSSHLLRVMPRSILVLRMIGERMCRLPCLLELKLFVLSTFLGLLERLSSPSNLTFCRMKPWDSKHLGKAKKAMPLPLCLTVSDLSTYLQMKSPKRKTQPDHEFIQQFVVKKLLLSN